MSEDGELLPTDSGASAARSQSRAQVTAWFLALLPVSWLAFDVLALELFDAKDSSRGSLLAATLMNWVVVVADSETLRKAGVRVSAWWGILLLPVYVVLRTKRSRSSPMVPVLFFALFATYVISVAPILDGLESAQAMAASVAIAGT